MNDIREAASTPMAAAHETAAPVMEEHTVVAEHSMPGPTRGSNDDDAMQHTDVPLRITLAPSRWVRQTA